MSKHKKHNVIDVVRKLICIINFDHKNIMKIYIIKIIKTLCSLDQIEYYIRTKTETRINQRRILFW